MKKSINSNRKGFSLLELIIVIVIIGVLIATIVGLMSAKEGAKVVTTQQEVINIKKSVDDYMRAKGLAMYNALGDNATFKPKLEKFIGNKLPKNPWSRDFEISGDSNGLTIKTNVGSTENCEDVANRLKKMVSDVSCINSTLQARWSD